MNCSERVHGRGLPRRRPFTVGSPWLVMPLFVLVAMVNLAPPVAAQISPRPVAQVLQVGIAAIPGAGVVAGYVSPRGFYTIDAVVYVDATPSFSGGEGSLLAS